MRKFKAYRNKKPSISRETKKPNMTKLYNKVNKANPELNLSREDFDQLTYGLKHLNEAKPVTFLPAEVVVRAMKMFDFPEYNISQQWFFEKISEMKLFNEGKFDSVIIRCRNGYMSFNSKDLVIQIYDAVRRAESTRQIIYYDIAAIHMYITEDANLSGNINDYGKGVYDGRLPFDVLVNDRDIERIELYYKGSEDKIFYVPVNMNGDDNTLQRTSLEGIELSILIWHDEEYMNDTKTEGENLLE